MLATSVAYLIRLGLITLITYSEVQNDEAAHCALFSSILSLSLKLCANVVLK